MMGEIVGMAASLCQKHKIYPRGVYKNHLTELKELMKCGVGKSPEPPKPPDWIKNAGQNLALSATVSVSGSLDSEKYPSTMINDGCSKYDNDLRWLSDKILPNYVELTWDKPQTISAVRIVSGYCEPGYNISVPIKDFVLQYHNGSDWIEIPGTKVTNNWDFDWSTKFPAIQSINKVRLVVTATATKISRIWEIEVYNPPDK